MFSCGNNKKDVGMYGFANPGEDGWNNNNWGVGVIVSSVKESVTKIQKDAAIRQSKFINQ